MRTPLFKKVILALLLPALPLCLPAADFYVSPNGNDNNPGTFNKPFATIGRARQEVILGLQNNNRADYTVWLQEGVYKIKKPIVINADDLNNEGMIIFRAIPGGQPVISGAVKIDGWYQNEGGLWVAELSGELFDGIIPRELFINNTRCIRARHPNKGWLRIKEAGTDRRTNFFFNEGDFPIPSEGDEPELVFFHDWSVSRIPVWIINDDNNQLTAVDSIGAKGINFFNIDNWESNPRYFLENSIEFLDSDYEWYFDKQGKKIYLKVPPEIRPDNENIYTPLSEGLFVLKGKEGNPVQNICFEGIAFRHSYWAIPRDGYCGVQACHFDPRPGRSGWAVVPAAVKVEWGENCSFKECSFGNLGGSGLWFAKGCRKCYVSDSFFEDISGNGIMIGEGTDRETRGDKWWKAAPEQVALGNRVSECIVRDCGVQFYGAVGVWCGLTAETVIEGNEIYNHPYTGISIGWMWSDVKTPSRENLIEGNHIYDIMKALSDGGGIYTLGLQPGSRILDNHIHDVSINAGRAESNGMFLDEGTTDILIAGNLIYNIAKSPLRFHRATTNLVKENYLFCGKGVPPVRYNNTKEDDIIKIGNRIFHEDDADYLEEIQKAKDHWNISFRK
jgi:hypothetical protein